jgi:hypothetical protein
MRTKGCIFANKGADIVVIPTRLDPGEEAAIDSHRIRTFINLSLKYGPSAKLSRDRVAAQQRVFDQNFRGF